MLKEDTIRATLYVQTHREAIWILATTNKDIWLDDAPPLLADFRENYCEKYAALPSNTHRAESTIKDANHSQIKCRDEILCSTYATAQSGIVERLNANCVEAWKSGTIKGNHSVAGGIHGERKRLSDGSEYDEKEYQMRVDGYVRSQEAIKFVMERHLKIENILTESGAKKKRWKDMRSDLSGNAKQFVVERVSDKVDDYTESFQKNKAPNALQRRTGLCPLMPVLTGRLPFAGLLKARDIDQVKMELLFRGLSDEGPWKNGLIARWKEDEGDNKFFITKCPEVDLEFIRLAKKGDADGQAPL